MKAVIMCGGKGTRLKPMTESIPKPLIKIMNRPVLDIIIEKLIEEGIKEIYLSLGYKSKDIIDYCENKKYDAEIIYCDEKTSMGTAGGVKNCINRTEDDVLILCGDNIFDFNLTYISDFHKKNDCDITVVGVESKDPREYGVIVKDEKNNIISFDEKPDWENVKSNIINTGMYIIKGEILNVIPENKFFDFAQNVFPLILNSNRNFKCYVTDKYWGDMGEFSSLKEMTKFLLETDNKFFDYRGKFIADDIDDENGNKIIAPCLIDENVVLAGNIVIGPYCVIDNNCRIEKNCFIKNSIINESCSIGSNTEINGSILCDKIIISENVAIENGVVIGRGTKIEKFSRILNNIRIWPTCQIPEETIINKDIFHPKNKIIDFDSSCLRGKICEEITLTDTIQFAKSIGNVDNINKAGIAFDGNEFGELYKSCMINGLRICGVNCYDFSEIAPSQINFYSNYCDLDVFIFLSVNNNDIEFKIFGGGGLPFSPTSNRNILMNYNYPPVHENYNCGQLYELGLFTSVYCSALKKKYKLFSDKININIETENKVIKKIFESLLGKNKNSNKKITLLFGNNDKNLYFLENNKVYSSDAVYLFLAEYYSAKGCRLIIPEDSSVHIEEIAAKYHNEVIRLYNSDDYKKISRSEYYDKLWAFDIIFLAFEICIIIAQSEMSLEELLQNSKDVIITRTIAEFKYSPGQLHLYLDKTFGKKSDKYNDYCVFNKFGSVRIRQIGNSNKLRILAEASRVETAKELCNGIVEKIKNASIDN